MTVGIISALSFSPDGTGTFAAGSYAGNVSIYSEDTGEDRLAEIALGETSAGITQVSGLSGLYMLYPGFLIVYTLSLESSLIILLTRSSFIPPPACRIISLCMTCGTQTEDPS